MIITHPTATNPRATYQRGDYPQPDIPIIVADWDDFLLIATYDQAGNRTMHVEEWHAIREHWQRVILPPWAAFVLDMAATSVALPQTLRGHP